MQMILWVASPWKHYKTRIKFKVNIFDGLCTSLGQINCDVLEHVVLFYKMQIKLTTTKKYGLFQNEK